MLLQDFVGKPITSPVEQDALAIARMIVKYGGSTFFLRDIAKRAHIHKRHAVPALDWLESRGLIQKIDDDQEANGPRIGRPRSQKYKVL